MKNKETGKVNASLVISMIALFVAISGAATAARENGETTKLPPNSVGSAQLKPEAVKKSDLGRKSVVASKMAPNSVTSEGLAPNAVKGPDLAPGSVGSKSLRRKSIDSEKIAPNAVTEDALAPGSVKSEALSNASVLAAKMAANSVNTQAIAPDAVTGAAIAAGAVDTEQLSEDAVTFGKVEAKPGAQVSGTNVALNLPFFFNCDLVVGAPSDIVQWSRGGVFDPAFPERLTAPADGIYSISASALWEADANGRRALYVQKLDADDNLLGTLHNILTLPVSEDQTGMSFSFEAELEEGQYVRLSAGECDASATIKIDSFTFGMTQIDK